MRLPAALTLVAGALSLALTGCASANQVGAGSGSAPSGGGSKPSSTSSSDGTSRPSSVTGGTAVTPRPSSSAVRAAAAQCPLPPLTPQHNPAAKPVPDDLTVSWVLRCRIIQTPNGSTLVAEQSTSDTAALLRALRAPSAQRANIVCPMLAVYLPNFALVQPDGQLFIPKLPLTNCGMPQPAVVAALTKLRFVEITSHPVR